ncbi:MAG: hypothetical protein H0W18_11500 [Acidobacteria bacterium]|nr:hypothetical protein [Acidobacteriota bacterium]
MTTKTGRRPARAARENDDPTERPAETAGSNARVEETLVDLAEDLGKLLGTAQHRMSTWLGERQQIATQLVQIRDTANAYLRDLTAGGATLADAVGTRAARGAAAEDKGSATGEPPPKTTARGRRAKP